MFKIIVRALPLNYLLKLHNHLKAFQCLLLYKIKNHNPWWKHLHSPFSIRFVNKINWKCAASLLSKTKTSSLLQIHSIHQRRKVQGRSKNFDQLVAELKMSSKARDRVSQAPESSASPTVSPEPPRDAPVPPLCRRPLMNSPAFRLETSIQILRCISIF